jgi:pimeloyl-ACP methyl ester carboxylesterase
MILYKLATSLLLFALLAGLAAALMLWRVRAIEAAANDAAPPIGQILTVGGAQVHALVQGTGPDLVLIHGAGGNLRDFTLGLMDELAKTHRVIAFDRPGLGWSDAIANGTDIAAQARHLRAAAAQLDVTTPIVLGHSFGGAVALAWASQAPDTRGLVLVSGATMPFPGETAQWYHLTGGPLGPVINPFITLLATDSRVKSSLVDTFAPNPVPETYAARIGAGLTTRRKTLAQNGAQVLAMKENLITMLPGYPELTLPVEVLHGRTDTTVPPQIHAIPLSKILPNARLTLFSDTGHMLHHAHPGAVIDAVNRLTRP